MMPFYHFCNAILNSIWLYPFICNLCRLIFHIWFNVLNFVRVKLDWAVENVETAYSNASPVHSMQLDHVAEIVLSNIVLVLIIQMQNSKKLRQTPTTLIGTIWSDVFAIFLILWCEDTSGWILSGYTNTTLFCKFEILPWE